VIEADDETITVERLTDEGNETLRIRLPAVLTVLKDLNHPRFPSLVSQMDARRRGIDRWAAAQVEGDAAEFGLNGSPTRVVRVFTPPPRGECRMLQGDADAVADGVIDALGERGLL
jgi:electron transfer flavoprotein beta subunit